MPRSSGDGNDVRPLQPQAAMSQMCELVRRFNRRSYEIVLEFDWGVYPRFRNLGLDRLDPAKPEFVRQICRTALEIAVEELESRHPAMMDDVSPITLLKRHVLDGDTWDVISAQRKETGLVRLSERTLKNRQHEAYRLILRWAQSETLPELPQLDLPFHRRKQQLKRAAFAGGIVMLLALAIWGLPQLKQLRQASQLASASMDLNTQLRRIDARYIGVPLRLDQKSEEGNPPLKQLVPALRLPSLGAPLGCLMLLPGPSNDDPRLLLTSQRGGSQGGRVWLWDAEADSFVWKLKWRPPRAEIFTHSTLDTTVYDQGWGVSSVAWRTGKLTLGSRLAICYQQFYSPCFLLIVDRESGAPLSHYTHPGHMYQPYLADLSEDGKPEILCAGTDNALNRPDLTVLEPEMEDGAASTCMWNKKGEGALFRVLLPAVRPLEKYFEDPRLAVRPIQDRDWSPTNGLLNVLVYGGGQENERAYFAHLYHGCEIQPGHGLSVEDHDDFVWRKIGLDFASMEQLLEKQIELLRGPRFDEVMGGVVPQLISQH